MVAIRHFTALEGFGQNAMEDIINAGDVAIYFVQVRDLFRYSCCNLDIRQRLCLLFPLAIAPDTCYINNMTD